MQFKELTTENEIRSLLEGYNKGASYVVLDTETVCLDRHDNRILAVTVTAADSGEAFYFDGSYASLLETLKTPIVLHNFKFDYHVCRLHGVDLRNNHLLYDTLILDHLLDENNSHGLDDIVQRLYKDDYKSIFWGKYKQYSEAPRNEQIEYACKDVLYTDRICSYLISALSKDNVPTSLITHVNKLALTLYDTECEGVNVDLPYVSKKGEDLSQQITSLKTKMRELVELECQVVENTLYEKELDKRKTPKGKLGVKRPEFSFNSPAQLGSLLYDTLRLPPKFDKKRSRTVDAVALESLEGDHELIKLLIEYRGHQKVFTSFIEGTLEKVHNGKIYPSFNPTGTVTGRISSSNPNLQQLPSSGGVRGIYVPQKGYKLVSSDYKQLEVTLAAHFSGDPNLLKIVYEGASQHDITARGLGIPRTLAKTINFALQYGAGPSKIKSVLGCSDRESELAYQKYWETYPGLREFNRSCHDKIERGEPLINPFGRRRNFPKKFENHWAKERAKRQAPNALIQGTGSDCTSWSLYTVNSALLAKGLGKVLFSVHDEIIIEVLDNKVDESREILKTIMEGVSELIKLTVPLKADVSEGMERWED